MRRGRAVRQVHFGFRTDLVSVLEAPGLIGHEAAAMRQADFQSRIRSSTPPNTSVAAAIVVSNGSQTKFFM